MITNLEKIARKNRHYYLSEKKTDEGKCRWFWYIKTMDAYSEAVLLSPAMAQELLESDENFSLRRPVKEDVIRELAQDLKANKFSHHTISISFSGKLLDGRNLLEAVIMNKKSAIVFCSFNISDKLSFLFG